MEHRWGDRRQVILRVQLHAPDQTWASGWLTDISLSGAYVRTVATLGLMSQITIEVTQCAFDSRAGPLRLPGRVVRLAPAGIGVEWEEFASGMLGEIVQPAEFPALPAHGAPHEERDSLTP